ncbi:MAG: EI24 domain-containing protein [Bacteroidota bacterium]|uniref:EI24 domain-containing protein n=1 Tax=Leeuwenhoekiella palythoae TaxID=573501 RepID=UPI000E9B4432|nr:EI24 domain-containing protein [Leeuwenhoekiella palythoae]MEC7782886.1 EI24 domain-containing protein [Bacteroidota bacterium]MEE3147533.1 EI24 domain-containing protein [Bacteroidota bacterium]UBZ11808.1 EI24 domain-containing protein [Leeuwenhoekiella palythoae]HAX15207.1 coproporphyrinogen III oxidase [Leeuwenhoekiella sp.]|tara:strand:+ start:115 stop:855 length:741 start_codon:yes stop_codon:yes gene_type:complete
MIKAMLNGLLAYKDALPLISKLNLWKYFAVPMLISFITALSIGFSAYGFSDDLGGLISSLWIWEWGASTVRTISDIAGALLIIAFGLIAYKHIVMALSAPFMSPVSEKIEAHLYANVHQHRNTSNASQLLRGLKINLRNLAWELLLSIPFLLLSLIPVVGVLATASLFLIQAYYAGFGNMDYTLERHFSYRESINFVKAHRGFATGNGIVFMLFLLIPFVGIILVLPISVTAASTTTLQLLKKQSL